MKFTGSTGGGGNYEKPKVGIYLGVLIGVADIGTQATQFGSKRKVMLRWELHKRKGPSLDSTGAINTITAMYNQSFDAKSSLRPVIEAHIGALEDGQATDSDDWLGKAARLVLKESDDGKYVNVSSVTALDAEEDEVPERREPTETWEFGRGTPPPNWCKHMVERSDEWILAPASPARKPVGAATGASNDDDDDDDIPF